MNDILSALFTPWGWVGLGLILLVVEIVVPGTFMLWLGLAAIITGVTTLTLGLSLPMQLVSFAVFSVVAVLIGREHFQRKAANRSTTEVNALEDRYVGLTVTVVEAIENGRGRVKVADSPWIAEGADAPVGTKVRITRVDGAVLHVERTNLPV